MSYLSDLATVEIEREGTTLRLVGGSFRGVPFFVSSHTYGSGRRVAVHEFPGKDDPYNEDMGRSSRSVSLDVYLVGENVKAQKNALLSVLEQAGSGRLVHPYMGEKKAQCTAVNITETALERRWVSISLSFVLDADLPGMAGSVADDKKAQTALRASAAAASTAAKFAKSFNLLHAAKSTVDAVRGISNTLLDKVEQVRGTMRTASAFVDEIKGIRENIDLLLLAPAELAERFQRVITSTEDGIVPSGVPSVRVSIPWFGGTIERTPAEDQAALLARLQFEESLGMAETLNPVSSNLGTASGAQAIATNGAYLFNLYRLTAAYTAAAHLGDAQVVSIEDARALQERFSALFDSILEGLDDPDTFQEVQDVQAAALSYLRATSANLASVVEVVPNRTTSAPVLAFEKYGSTANAADLIIRNGVPHPGFLPGGRTLEALSK